MGEIYPTLKKQSEITYKRMLQLLKDMCPYDLNPKIINGHDFWI